jgi:hypothetical protein
MAETENVWVVRAVADVGAPPHYELGVTRHYFYPYDGADITDEQAAVYIAKVPAAHRHTAEFEKITPGRCRVLWWRPATQKELDAWRQRDLKQNDESIRIIARLAECAHRTKCGRLDPGGECCHMKSEIHRGSCSNWNSLGCRCSRG